MVAPLEEEGPQRAQDLHHLVQELVLQQPHEMTADAGKHSQVLRVIPTAHMADVARQLVTAARRPIIAVPDAKVVVPAEEPQRAQELAQTQQPHEMTVDAGKISRVPHVMPTARMADVARQLVIVARRPIIAVPDARVVVPPEGPEGPQRALELAQLDQELAHLAQDPAQSPCAQEATTRSTPTGMGPPTMSTVVSIQMEIMRSLHMPTPSPSVLNFVTFAAVVLQ